MQRQASRIQIQAGEKIIAVGGFGTGKTTAFVHLLELHPYALVFDPLGEIDPGLPRAEQKPTMTPGRWETVQRLEDLAQTRKTHVSVCLPHQDLDEFCQVALDNLRSGLAVGIMEIGDSLPGTSPASLPQPVSTLWRTAHKKDTTVLPEAHRTNELPKITRRADKCMAYQLPKDDADDLATLYGIPELSLAANLAKLEYLLADVHTKSITWHAPIPIS